ncbi:MAG: FlgD immunoglobulin-like domain containing protein [Candidatus Eisenbacteria bacterium]
MKLLHRLPHRVSWVGVLFVSVLLGAPWVSAKRAASDDPHAARPVRRLSVPEVAGEWLVWRDEATGLARRLSPLRAGRVPRKNGSPDRGARAVLEELPAFLGIGSILSELEVVLVKRGLASEHVVFRRRVGGVPLEPGRVAVHFGRSGGVLWIDCTVDSRPAPAKALAALSGEKALDIAAGGAPAEAGEAELVYREEEQGLRLVWRVRFFDPDSPGLWEADVDARSGEVLERANRSMRIDGSGTIWTPNPVSVLSDTTLRDMNDADQAVFDPVYRVETLRDLDEPGAGSDYVLEGRFVRIADFENPSIPPPARSHPDSFRTKRSDDAFEAVMAYWHLDTAQRYLRSLGFDGVNADTIGMMPITVDVHAFNGDDNSRYDPPPLHRLVYGDGCVDDAEDADVLIHEYGHVVEYGQVPNWGYPSGYMGAMAEGFSDYWAESYSARSGVTFDLGQVFDWDKNRMEYGEATRCGWPGRRVDNHAVVPDSLRPLTGGNIYINSLIWSGALWEIHRAVGGEAADRTILESHLYLNGTSPNSTFEDAAWALLQADHELSGGANALGIFEALQNRGILTEENTAEPVILWAAHPETLVTGTALLCSLSLSAVVPIRAARVVYGRGAAGEDTLDLAPSGEGLYAGSIAIETGTDSILYFYEAVDALDRAVRLPADEYRTYVVVDTEAPRISHVPLRDFLESELPVPITAVVNDNSSIDPDSVIVSFVFTGVGGLADSGDFPLAATAADSVFTGTFPAVPGRVGAFSYRIAAVDLSPLRNRASSPESGFYSFDVYPSETRVLLGGPNPFKESVSFQVALPEDSDIRLSIYDLSGRLVRGLADGPAGGGVHAFEWDGKNGEGRRVAPGIYLYRLEARGEEKAGTVVLLR